MLGTGKFEICKKQVFTMKLVCVDVTICVRNLLTTKNVFWWAKKILASKTVLQNFWYVNFYNVQIVT